MTTVSMLSNLPLAKRVMFRTTGYTSKRNSSEVAELKVSERTTVEAIPRLTCMSASSGRKGFLNPKGMM